MTKPTVREWLEKRLESRRVHWIILGLIGVDFSCIMTIILLEFLAPDKYDTDNELIEGLEVLAFFVNIMFLLEITLHAFVYGFKTYFFKNNHWLIHIFDATIVLATFLLEIFLKGKQREVAGLLVLFRLWRVIKVMSVVAVSVEEYDKHHIEELELKISELEEELRRLFLEVDDISKEDGWDDKKRARIFKGRFILNSDLEILIPTDDHEDNPCFDCVNPCSTHPSYPSYLKIDYNSPLEDTLKPYFKHVLISTGKADWITRVEDDSASLAGQLHKIIKANDSSKSEKLPRIVITNSSRENTDNDPKFLKGNDVLLFPDNILIRNVNPNNASEFFKTFLLPPPSSPPSPSPWSHKDQNISFQVDPTPYKAVIVICSHKRRDKRCGITGPILKNEFDRILKDKGLDVERKKNEGVAVFLSSHTGGHKFAGNVIVYRDGQGIWYGRVIPCHVESIIESTVIEGKVIKDLYRGSMNGSFAPGKGGRLDW
ncbi:3068_t:CDS:2 [Entrophospora sp. SA101]|nr:3068_t:CDS:2 [Entrophospora sp. SA101]CAJ0907364.1 2474_t:CDS:2 [Entrophospora sp. SA101]